MARFSDEPGAFGASETATRVASGAKLSLRDLGARNGRIGAGRQLVRVRLASALQARPEGLGGRVRPDFRDGYALLGPPGLKSGIQCRRPETPGDDVPRLGKAPAGFGGLTRAVGSCLKLDLIPDAPLQPYLYTTA